MVNSHQAFADVDKMVSKPVFGSDGALAWKKFRDENKQARKGGVFAPNLPMKRSDRLGTGFKSVEEERLLENEIRKKSGNALIGEGYTEFKRRGRDPEEAALKKKRIKIESRIRPDNVQYYIPSTNFIGWKKDYVFTTRENYGTGYYWDGTDSARESFCVSNPGSNEPSASSCAQPSIPNNYWDKISHIADRGAVCDSKNNNRNKEAKRSITTEVEVAASYNPLEQVSNAISRAAKAVMDIPATTMPSGDKATQDELTDCSLAAAGWVRALDPLSGKTYFYHRTTKETSWDVPLSSSRNTERNFPAGWSAATDQKSGLEYYFHESGETTWVRPSV